MKKENATEDWLVAMSRRVVTRSEDNLVETLEVREYMPGCSRRLGEMTIRSRDGRPVGMSLELFNS